MTPGARAAAAIGILDRWLAGSPVEQALTNWGRASRYAGSGDRAAVRDLVFDAVRCRRSFAALGGAMTGRGLVLGWCRDRGEDAEALFTGEGHAPAALTGAERAVVPVMTENEALDCPDWLAPALRAGLGEDFVPVMQALRLRAPVFLRVNLARIGREDAVARLAAEGITARLHPLAKSALEVTDNARKISGSVAYAEGLVELQDAASQAVVEALPLADGMRVLDYCAGGGGKTLAMAARARLEIDAHDTDAGRLRDLPVRAARAGVSVRLAGAGDLTGKYDLVLADAPCSGSGAWRRSPEGKWALTPARLAELMATQAAIMDRIAPLVRPDGWLAYATCSLLNAENQDQVGAFLTRHPGFRAEREMRLTPLDGGDGFFLALMRRIA